jgi:hypothetical protein
LTYYVREVQGQPQTVVQIWKITDGEAIRLGSQEGGLWHYRRLPDETIWEAIRRLGAWQRPDGSLPIHELKLARALLSSDRPTHHSRFVKLRETAKLAAELGRQRKRDRRREGAIVDARAPTRTGL